MLFENGKVLKLLFILLGVFISIVCPLSLEEKYAEHIRENKIKRYDLKDARSRPIRNSEGKLAIFCYDGEPKKKLSKLFTTVSAKITTVGDDLRVYVGSNETEVFAQHLSAATTWLGWLARSPLTDRVSLATFNKTCIAIDTDQQYQVTLLVKLIDPLFVGLLVAGLILLFTARRLSRNVVFYYGTGVSVGVLASVLVLIFIVSKVIPKKSVALYTVWLGGGSLILFLWKHVYDNLQALLESYMHIVLGYLGLTALLSFAICYYKGPPTEPRKLDLIQWTIQLLAVLMIFNCTQIVEVSIVILLMTFTCYFFPCSATSAVRTYWRRKFPPKIKLLTQDEYEMQAQEETRKALAELREYCRSPDCDAWRTISRLNNPHRFSAWMSGDESELHVSQEESYLYDSDPCPPLPSHLDDDYIDVLN